MIQHEVFEAGGVPSRVHRRDIFRFRPLLYLLAVRLAALLQVKHLQEVNDAKVVQLCLINRQSHIVVLHECPLDLTRNARGKVLRDKNQRVVHETVRGEVVGILFEDLRELLFIILSQVNRLPRIV